MPRNRIVHPGLFTDDDLYEAEKTSGLPIRLAYAGLTCVADREGRFEWKPRQLKLDVLPYDQCDFDTVLEALASGGWIRAYVVDGRKYAHIPNFLKFQKPHRRESPSALPPPPERRGSAEGKPRVGLGSVQGGAKAAGLRSQSQSQSLTTVSVQDAPSGAKYSPEFEQARAAYPKRPGDSKAEAYRAWNARLGQAERVEVMQAGIDAYREACLRDKTEPRFIKHMATFLGPDRHYLNDYTPAPEEPVPGEITYLNERPDYQERMAVIRLEREREGAARGA